MFGLIKRNLAHVGALIVSFLLIGPVACTTQEGDSVLSQQPDDTDITTTVVDELKITRGIDAEIISVETNEGIVTLEGSADNLLTKERAASVASTVRGVRAVVNDIQVIGEHPDVEIATDVADALLSDPATDTWEIESSVEDGVVILSGTVESWREKELAATVAKGVAGVTGVENNITVNYDTDRPDAEIQGEIAAALAWNSRLDDGLINVDVNDGVVVLSGTVGSLFEKNLATTLAHVAGVAEVNNANLEVKSWMRNEMERNEFLVNKSDEDIEQAIRDAFAVHPRINSEKISVDVENGIASLSGSVTNLKTARAAAQIAENTRGVIATDKDLAVQNDLEVIPDVNNTDEEIRQDVEEALQKDPFVGSLDIDVVVEAGVVTLSGTVDNYFLKYQADEVASTVNGVTDIVNNIEVDYEELVYEPMFYDWDVIDHDYDYEPVVIEDEQLEGAIENQMLWSPFVNSENVNVEVEDGVATLTGNVLSEKAADEATEEAYEAGAKRVINNLEYSK